MAERLSPGLVKPGVKSENFRGYLMNKQNWMLFEKGDFSGLNYSCTLFMFYEIFLNPFKD